MILCSEAQRESLVLGNANTTVLNPHSAEGLTEKRISSKVTKKRGGVKQCHRKWSTKRKDWIIWE